MNNKRVSHGNELQFANQMSSERRAKRVLKYDGYMTINLLMNGAGGIHYTINGIN